MQIEQLYYGRHRLSFRIGTYLALIRMMGVAHLVTTLYGHALLVSETQARLARTRQTLRELICHGFDSDAGRLAVQRLREAHRHVKADADDYRYVLATFFLEPLRWNAEHARVKLDSQEEALLLAFWQRVGQEMHITELPATLPQWRQFQQAYEARHLRHTPEGERLARMCLRDVVKLTVPLGTRWAFRQWMLATMEPAVRDVLGLVDASGWGNGPLRVVARAVTGAVSRRLK
jgi:hypothetical protein